eukprot:m.209886 g.209886  ORF g.209886 m.209886 type:complete len:305 (+) comp13778_c1_seq1:333-1247(+)
MLTPSSSSAATTKGSFRRKKNNKKSKHQGKGSDGDSRGGDGEDDNGSGKDACYEDTVHVADGRIDAMVFNAMEKCLIVTDSHGVVYAVDERFRYYTRVLQLPVGVRAFSLFEDNTGECLWICASDFSLRLLHVPTLTVAMTVMYSYSALSSPVEYLTNFLLTSDGLLLAGTDQTLLMARLPDTYNSIVSALTRIRKKQKQRKKSMQKKNKKNTAATNSGEEEKRIRNEEDDEDNVIVTFNDINKGVTDAIAVVDDWLNTGTSVKEVFKAETIGEVSNRPHRCGTNTNINNKEKEEEEEKRPILL